MEKRLIFFISFFILTSISRADDNCLPASCGPNEPIIRFPFRLIGRQPSTCGFPRFDLSCNKQNQTIIQFPSSRSYTVNRINYLSQVIYIVPNFCGRNEINTFNVTNTPFYLSNMASYAFYNCSIRNLGFIYTATLFPCLSSPNHSVIAIGTGFIMPGNIPESCEAMKTIRFPVQWGGDIRSEFNLMWFTPSCERCELDGKGCGFVNEYGQTGCIHSSHGFPAKTKYGLSIGIGVLVLVTLMGLICYRNLRAGDYGGTRNESVGQFSIAAIPQPLFRTGLDGSIIESYPKTMLGESCRLPGDDSTCAICLLDYKTKESLRTIPECSHYFHVDCIDEWLKLNRTCPVCRNSLKNSSLVTPCSTVSTSVVDSS